jgi:hypothetical protein
MHNTPFRVTHDAWLSRSSTRRRGTAPAHADRQETTTRRALRDLGARCPSRAFSRGGGRNENHSKGRMRGCHGGRRRACFRDTQYQEERAQSNVDDFKYQNSVFVHILYIQLISHMWHILIILHILYVLHILYILYICHIEHILHSVHILHTQHIVHIAHIMHILHICNILHFRHIMHMWHILHILNIFYMLLLKDCCIQPFKNSCFSEWDGKLGLQCTGLERRALVPLQ